MTVVIDASVLVKWFVEEEGSNRARNLQDLVLYGPDLLVVETTNVLWKKARTGSFDPAYLQSAVGVMRAAGIRLTDSLTLAERAVEIAVRLNHAVYDCFYLALAERLDFPLVSADDSLRRKLNERPDASRARTVSLSAFVA